MDDPQHRGKLLFALAAFLMFCLGKFMPIKTCQNDVINAVTQPNCSEAYPSDIHAYRACMSAFALQHNWYPSPIAGLFSYPVWNGFDGFWQDGAALETLANFMWYGNNTMYKSVITASIRDLWSLLVAYGPQPSYDDMGWYAISYLRIHEVLGPADDDPTSYNNFFGETIQIYNWIWEYGWDEYGECGGGFWFDQTLGSKQTVENAQMLFLAAKLHRITGNDSFANQTETIWKFIDDNNIINNVTFLVADGINLTTCGSDEVYGPSYNMGLMISALVEAGPVLNRTDEFLNIAHSIAFAAIKLLTKNGTLVEYCTPTCDDDAKLFKGIFLRNLRYLLDYMDQNPRKGDVFRKGEYISYLRNNSDTVWKSDRCEPLNEKCDVMFTDGPSLNDVTVGPVFSKDFRGPYNISNPITQTAVLDLFVSSINSETKCAGKDCGFDPPQPTPKPLTCKNNPCPPNQPCCAYSDYYTCCEPSQKCVAGYCV
uniref:uncharacterized protein LOC120327196 isoform X1 n=1 Tax=Styela clava TaxID=7725 RepID=UPI001939637D|nr:uncharacterized protein LOC120327196 isoform X1 [Styela clava]